MTIHAKPTFNFQTLEFDLDVYGEEDMKKLKDFYRECLELLIEVTTVQQKEEKVLATEKQKAIMDKYKIPYDDDTTSTEAQQLIQKSIEDFRNKRK